MNRASTTDKLCLLPGPDNAAWKEAQVVYNLDLVPLLIQQVELVNHW